MNRSVLPWGWIIGVGGGLAGLWLLGKAAEGAGAAAGKALADAPSNAAKRAAKSASETYLNLYDPFRVLPRR